MKFSIITIGYKSLTNVKNCFHDAFNSQKIPDEFIIVINYYDENTKAILDYVSTEKRVTRWAYVSQNMGCAKAFNLGFDLATTDIVVVLNDDCRVGVETYKNMLAAFDGLKVGIVGVEMGGKEKDSYKTAKGFLLAYRKEMLAQIGGYDEVASPLACERELGLRAKANGWETVIVSATWQHTYDISAYRSLDTKINYLGKTWIPRYDRLANEQKLEEKILHHLEKINCVNRNSEKI